MCGRFTIVQDGRVIMDYYSQLEAEEAFERMHGANYNAAPTHTLPAATAEGLEFMTWGLVPSWFKEFKPAFTSINARAETVAEKPLYRTPFKKRRALIPASGFYEWQKRVDFKQPYYFYLPDREMFSFAGLYDIWYEGDIPHKSFTIITTVSNDTMEGVHDRMPVILDRDEEEHWIDPEAEPEQLHLLLNPYDNEMLRHEVDRAVGNVKNNHVGLLNSL